MEGQWVTFWHYVADEGTATAAQVVASLDELHAGLAKAPDRTTFPPCWNRLEIAVDLLDGSEIPRGQAVDDSALLRRALLDGIAALTSLSKPPHVLHGSPHRFNILVMGGKAVFIDFETVELGPSNGTWPTSMWRWPPSILPTLTRTSCGGAALRSVHPLRRGAGKLSIVEPTCGATLNITWRSSVGRSLELQSAVPPTPGDREQALSDGNGSGCRIARMTELGEPGRAIVTPKQEVRTRSLLARPLVPASPCRRRPRTGRGADGWSRR